MKQYTLEGRASVPSPPHAWLGPSRDWEIPPEAPFLACLSRIPGQEWPLLGTCCVCLLVQQLPCLNRSGERRRAARGVLAVLPRWVTAAPATLWAGSPSLGLSGLGRGSGASAQVQRAWSQQPWKLPSTQSEPSHGPAPSPSLRRAASASFLILAFSFPSFLSLPCLSFFGPSFFFFWYFHGKKRTIVLNLWIFSFFSSFFLPPFHLNPLSFKKNT